MGGTHGLTNNQKECTTPKGVELSGQFQGNAVKSKKKHLEILKSQGVFELL
ncbi:hypothetical protein SAMN04489723_11639 [Algoriphagus aquimarinus]|uniref:Uncharacterized protein n=1 Tax=Algoriphagus aquimarinus TaxID=237018 RepID=A0A1I1BPQ0_9BACT|nr:hypothetical protein SAMN04489723_11639 [Algoriphagus aquimarinus]